MALWSVSSVGAVLVGLHWGIVGVAVSFAVTSTLLTPLSIWLTARTAGTTLREFGANLAPVAVSSLATAGAVFAARMLLVELGVSAGPRLALVVVLGIAIHLPLVAWRMPDVAADLRRFRAATAG